eukprot:14350262-Heterocapsa_arctica.AAC.1
MSGLCNAIVQLDNNCEVQTLANQLAVLLLRQSNTSLVSPNFLDFVKEDSAEERLQQVLRARDGGYASTLHVILCRACGASVPVQIFHTEFEDPHGPSAFHLIGVCEFGDPGSMGRVV